MISKFCAITPDRGDRPQFLRHCIQQMWSQTLQPGDHLVVNYEPDSDKPDLVKRIRTGIEMAKDRGFSRVYIIENDDYYEDDYFEKMEAKRAKFIGSNNTTYYHLSGSYTNMFHPGRSSLFTTGFDIDALDDFEWPHEHRLDLDILLWQHAMLKPDKCLLLDQAPAIGIKHGIGLCGGSGHKSTFRYSYSDNIERNWLRDSIRPFSFDFYQSLI